MPVFLPFIPALCSLRKTTYYAGNYARVIAASLLTIGPHNCVLDRWLCVLINAHQRYYFLGTSLGRVR